MPIGPGKYDDLCTAAREAAKAKGVILLIFEGDKGDSFCCQLPPVIAMQIPNILRDMADQIEESMR